MPTSDHQRRPPYAPVKGIRDFFDKVMTRQAPARINRERLVQMDVAAGNEQHVVAALRFLRLIDEDGRPTAHLDALYLKSPGERRRGLQNMLRLAYPALFTGAIDLTSATREQLHDFFVRHYGLRGQMARKATALFAFLAGMAEMPLAAELAPASGSDRRLPDQSSSRQRSRVTAALPQRQGATQPADVGLSDQARSISILITPEMSEDDIVALLARVQRALSRVQNGEDHHHE